MGSRHWHAKSNVSNLIQAREHVAEERTISRLQDALSMAVDRVGDRKTGSFLSGGTDSSLITFLLQSQRSTPVDTVTIGFEDADHDEMDWAHKVASHLGTRHSNNASAMSRPWPFCRRYRRRFANLLLTRPRFRRCLQQAPRAVTSVTC
ncbi:asparagine synthase-related protein [Xanthomonas citri]|uniref:asparagine synthase-related protein n=2 Tax=Xanthomonas citri TaxID=346 RepID=UPI00296E5AF4